MMKLLIAMNSEFQIVLQIMQDDKALAHILLDRQAALKVAGDLERLAECVPETRS